MINIFGARRANVPGLGAREPRAEELALPKSVESGNLGLNKAVIRWMSVKLIHLRFSFIKPLFVRWAARHTE